MKRLIRSAQSILGMADSREKIRNAALSYSDEVAMHVMKCVIYSSESPYYNHWIHEIANWIFEVSDMSPKKGFKIKPKDYAEWVFNYFGEDLDDYKRDVRRFHNDHVNHGNYGEFDISYDLYSTLYGVALDLKSQIPSRMNAYTSIREVQDDLHRILDSKCTCTDWLGETR